MRLFLEAFWVGSRSWCVLVGVIVVTIMRRRDNDVDFGISAQSDSKRADFSPEALGAKGPKHNTYNPKRVEPMATEWLKVVFFHRWHWMRKFWSSPSVLYFKML